MWMWKVLDKKKKRLYAVKILREVKGMTFPFDFHLA
jgi:hypothetical protein